MNEQESGSTTPQPAPGPGAPAGSSAAAASSSPRQPAPHPQGIPAQGQPPAGPPPFRPAPVKDSPMRRGFGLGSGFGLGLGVALIVASLVASLLSGFLMMGMAAAAGSLAGSAQTTVESQSVVWGPHNAAKTLRAIPISGAIQTSQGDGFTLGGGTYGYEVAEVLDRLKPEEADGVVLLINTPGGSVTGSKAISDGVDRYRQRTGKKVYAYVEGMSASGGMYAMAGADEIVADHGSITGSVGVIMGPLERYRDVTSTGSLLVGQTTAREITAENITAGKGKDAGTPWRDMTPEERKNLQDIADSMYGEFVDHVATKRGIDRAVIVNELGAGIFANERAKQIGYIDEQMNRDEAFRHFATASGLDPAQTKIVESGAPGLWASLLGAQNRAWGVAPAAQPIAGQAPRATSRLCTDPTLPLAHHGSLVSVCG